MADWAVVRVDRPSWGPEAVVAIHPDAGIADAWPAEELWAAGYPSRFFPAEGVDPRVPARVLRLVRTSEEPPGLELAGGLRELAGLSGGGVFAWDAVDARLELVGVYVGQVEVHRRLEGPLGLSVPSGSDHRVVVEPVSDAAR